MQHVAISAAILISIVPTYQDKCSLCTLFVEPLNARFYAYINYSGGGVGGRHACNYRQHNRNVLRSVRMQDAAKIMCLVGPASIMCTNFHHSDMFPIWQQNTYSRATCTHITHKTTQHTWCSDSGSSILGFTTSVARLPKNLLNGTDLPV